VTGWSAVLCADWSKHPSKREVYAASVPRRRVWRVQPPVDGWTVHAVLNSAEQLHEGGAPALVGFDAPIGLPASFLKLATPALSFLEWLRSVADAATFRAVHDRRAWSARRPFFFVPKGKGSRSAFEDHLHSLGVSPKRGIDDLCRANPVFIAGGIAGSVGSAAIDLWQALRRPDFRCPVWPFDGKLTDLVNNAAPVVVAEIYPRLAYSLAVGPACSSERRLMRLSKTQPSARVRVLESLLGKAAWLQREGVAVADHWMALASEDAFDAFVTVTGLLRCLLEGTPLSDPHFEDQRSEGGILGTGSVRLGAAMKPAESPPTRNRRRRQRRQRSTSHRRPSEPAGS
jgi:hypothetical protein